MERLKSCLLLAAICVFLTTTDSQACGGSRSQASGYLTSPNFPRTYNHNSFCSWNITIPSGTVYLKFTDFSLEDWTSTGECEFDDVKIFDGFNNTLIAELCGQLNSTMQVINGLSRSVKIVFDTDGSVSKDGFRLTWGEITCGDSPVFEHTNASHTTFGRSQYKQAATYSCLPGYSSANVSALTSRCQGNHWSPVRCAVKCQDAPVVLNSTRTVSGLLVNDSISFRCDLGFRLLGQETISCLSTRNWTTPPTCVVMDCGPPPVMVNGQIQTDNYTTTFRSRVVYSCDGPGYQMTGPSNVECRENGNWSTIPTCHRWTCAEPLDVGHSTKTVNGYYYSDNTTYQCDPGYHAIGNETIYCSLLKRWTTLPQCIKKDCGPPPEIEDGQVTPGQRYNTTFGSLITYICTGVDNRMAGPPNVRCSEDGAWSTLPICYRINCGPPPVISNSIHTASGQSYNDAVTYTCETGFVLSLNPTIRCLITGHWSAPPTCSGLSCGNPPDIDNALNVFIRDRYSVGDTVNYICQRGYRLNGNSVKCLSNQQWSATPECTRVDCSPPPAVLNSIVNGSSYAYNDFAIYECQTGYRLIGNASVQCQASGRWTAPPRCTALRCGNPPIVENAVNSSAGGRHFVGDKAVYVCKAGHLMNGYPVAKCLPNQQWSTAPRCSSVSCGNPPQVQNSQRVPDETNSTIGGKVSYSCQVGYKLSGNPTIECLSNQQWSSLPQCTRINCGRPPSIENGRRRVNGHYFGNTTSYECGLGYLLSGNQTSSCLIDGHWSTTPECLPVSCGNPPSASNSRIESMTGFQLGDTVRYQCMGGYSAINPLFITCQLNGTWSPTPDCKISADKNQGSDDDSRYIMGDRKPHRDQIPQTFSRERKSWIIGCSITSIIALVCIAVMIALFAKIFRMRRGLTGGTENPLYFNDSQMMTTFRNKDDNEADNLLENGDTESRG